MEPASLAQLLVKLLLFMNKNLLHTIKFSGNSNTIINNPKLEQNIRKANISVDNDTLLRMYDASSKAPTGLLEGRLYDLGDFDECYNIQSGSVYGKYCLGSLKINLKIPKFLKTIVLKRLQIPQITEKSKSVDVAMESMRPHWAVCVPNSYNASQIPGMMTFTEEFCYSKDTEPDLSVGAIVTIVILSFFALMTIASTVFETYLYYTKKASPHEILIAFSILSNGRRIFSAKTNPNQLLCLEGIRALTIMWIVLCHQYSISVLVPIVNIKEFVDWTQDSANMFILGGVVSVDSFLLVSGFLKVFILLKYEDKGIKFNIIRYYIHRYLRLTPTLALVILVQLYLLSYFVSGPISRYADLHFVDMCKRSWWSSLLYLTNYFNNSESCPPQGWYLSVEMQLFVLSPLVLIPLIKWPNIGIGALGILAVAGIIVPFAVAFDLNIGATVFDPNFSLKYYFKTYTIFGPYVIGMLLGYVIYKIKKTEWTPKLPPFQVALIVIISWIVCVTGLVACVYSGHDLASGKNTSKWSNSLFMGFDRPAWAVALAGVILLCLTGYGGPINSFLSAPIFQFLSKLSYSIFLIHVQVLVARHFSRKSNYKFSNLTQMYDFCGNFMLILFLSLILNLVFESPIAVIEKHIFGKRANDSGRRKHSNEQIGLKLQS